MRFRTRRWGSGSLGRREQGAFLFFIRHRGRRGDHGGRLRPLCQDAQEGRRVTHAPKLQHSPSAKTSCFSPASTKTAGGGQDPQRSSSSSSSAAPCTHPTRTPSLPPPSTANPTSPPPAPPITHRTTHTPTLLYPCALSTQKLPATPMSASARSTLPFDRRLPFIVAATDVMRDGGNRETRRKRTDWGDGGPGGGGRSRGPAQSDEGRWGARWRGRVDEGGGVREGTREGPRGKEGSITFCRFSLAEDDEANVDFSSARIGRASRFAHHAAAQHCLGSEFPLRSLSQPLCGGLWVSLSALSQKGGFFFPAQITLGQSRGSQRHCMPGSSSDRLSGSEICFCSGELFWCSGVFWGT